MNTTFPGIATLPEAGLAAPASALAAPPVAVFIRTLRDGGAERVASILSQHLATSRRLEFIVMEADAPDYAHGGRLHTLASPPSNNPLRKTLNFLTRIRRVRALKQRHGVTTTISFLESANFVNILARRSDRVVVSVRNYLSREFSGIEGWMKRRFIRLLYNRADAVVVVSEVARRDLVNAFQVDPHRIRVIYNPYPLETIAAQAREPLPVENAAWFQHPVVITVGRLREQKAQWQLIRAFRRVKERHPNARLAIVGRGPERAYLEQLVRDLQLSNTVAFLGFQSNPFRYVSRSALFVLPSLFEGFPNALVEALACGTPVIAADCKSGPREILAPGTDLEHETGTIELAPFGVLTPVGDNVRRGASDPLTSAEEHLANSISHLLHESPLRSRYAEAALARAQDFSAAEILRRWEDLL